MTEELTKAVFHRRTVRLSHRAAQDDDAIEHEVDPYKLWYVNNGLHIVGHDHWKVDLRVFAVDRIQWVKPINRRFEILADFDFERFTATAFNMIWGETPEEVKIRFSLEQARYIQERIWHPSQQIEKQLDGSTILTLKVADLSEFKRWLIGFGAEAEVLEPEALWEEIGRNHTAVAREAGRGFGHEAGPKSGNFWGNRV